MTRKPVISSIEYLAVLAAAALFAIVLFPSVSAARRTSKRVACASNLKGLGEGAYIYAVDTIQFPAASGTRKENDGLMRIFSPKDRTTRPASNGVPSPTVDLWMLLRENNNTPKQFNCPLTKDTPDPAKDTTAYYDFLTAMHLSYAYQFQHDPDRKPLGVDSEPIFPLMADANPYIKGGVDPEIQKDRMGKSRGNSGNHVSKNKPKAPQTERRRLGQNVLFLDSHVMWTKAPDVGLAGNYDRKIKGANARDNCYTVFEGGKKSLVDPGSAAPTATNCNLGGKSDACLVP